MYAIVRTGGKQYRVKEGDVIRVEKIEGQIGKKIVLKDVLMVKSAAEAIIGEPEVKKAKVETEIVQHKRGKKLHVYTFKRRKGEEKQRGHRQWFTELKVTRIIS